MSMWAPDKRPAATDSVVDRLAKAFECNLVTRKEYDELFLAITRLTDRIEALEDKLGPFKATTLLDTPYDHKVLSWDD